MEPNSYRFKIRLPDDCSSLSLSIPSSLSTDDLYKKVSELAIIPKNQFVLKNGFPPKNIEMSTTILISTATRSGDLLNLEKKNTTISTDEPAPEDDTLADLVHAPEAKRVRGAKKFQSEDDLSTHLIKLMGNRKMESLSFQDKGLKEAFRNAMQRREASNLAISRLNSLQNKTYTLASLGNDAKGIPKFQVEFYFKKQLVQEVYTAFPLLLIKAVLTSVYEGEDLNARLNLRSLELCEAQPMIFWNIVRLFDGDLRKGMTTMLPALDYDVLEGRRKIQSEKARLVSEQEAIYGNQCEQLDAQLENDTYTPEEKSEIKPTVMKKKASVKVTTPASKISSLDSIKKKRRSPVVQPIEKMEFYKGIPLPIGAEEDNSDASIPDCDSDDSFTKKKRSRTSALTDDVPVTRTTRSSRLTKNEPKVPTKQIPDEAMIAAMKEAQRKCYEEKYGPARPLSITTKAEGSASPQSLDVSNERGNITKIEQ